MVRIAITLAVGGLLTVVVLGCNGSNPLSGNKDKNRNAEVSFVFGSDPTLRDRVIALTGTLKPNPLSGDIAGATEKYRLTLFKSTDGVTFSAATLLTPGGVATEQTFPVGTATPVILNWDRDDDFSVDVQARVWLKLEADQVTNGNGIGTVTLGPKEIDTRASGGCHDRSPRITSDVITLTVNQPSAATVVTQFGDTPLTYSINEPLSGGLLFNTDGSVTGTPTTATSQVRLVTVTDSCLNRRDQAWITIIVQ